MGAGRSADVGRELERGRPLAERADASTAIGRAQRGAAREREGAFGNPIIIIADVRYSLVTKHYFPTPTRDIGRHASGRQDRQPGGGRADGGDDPSE